MAPSVVGGTQSLNNQIFPERIPLLGPEVIFVNSDPGQTAVVVSIVVVKESLRAHLFSGPP